MLNTDHAKTASGVADYQPAWEHDYDIKLLRTVLAHTAPLVSPEDIDMLRGTLRDAPRDSLVLQEERGNRHPRFRTQASTRWRLTTRANRRSIRKA